MRLRCFFCGKSVSTEVDNETLFRAIATCPECIEDDRILIPEDDHERATKDAAKLFTDLDKGPEAVAERHWPAFVALAVIGLCALVILFSRCSGWRTGAIG